MASPTPPAPKVHDFRALDKELTPAQQQEHDALLDKHRAARLDRGAALLNTGAEIPLIGLGTWQASPGEVKSAVLAALRAGYRHIDCASVYRNEEEVGRSLKEALSSGLVKRADLFITSKLWNDSHAPDQVERACRDSLERLGLDYLDLYLIHWPVRAGQTGGDALNARAYFETWQAMERLVSSFNPSTPPLVKAIGVSNLGEKKLRALMANPQLKVPPAVNQFEAHPLWRNDALLRCCAELGVHVTAYSPLGSKPDALAAAMGDKSPPPPSLLRHPAVVAAAESATKRCGKPRSPAQVLLRWNLERGVSVLPKSVHPERIAANLDVLSREWALSSDERNALSSIEPQARMLSGSLWVNTVQGPYKTLSDLWDEPEGADERQREAVAALAKMGPDWKGGSGGKA
jgi:diketogulonate reductase-like aldo/keto reductase